MIGTAGTHIVHQDSAPAVGLDVILTGTKYGGYKE